MCQSHLDQSHRTAHSTDRPSTATHNLHSCHWMNTSRSRTQRPRASPPSSPQGPALEFPRSSEKTVMRARPVTGLLNALPVASPERAKTIRVYDLRSPPPTSVPRATGVQPHTCPALSSSEVWFNSQRSLPPASELSRVWTILHRRQLMPGRPPPLHPSTTIRTPSKAVGIQSRRRGSHQSGSSSLLELRRLLLTPPDSRPCRTRTLTGAGRFPTSRPQAALRRPLVSPSATGGRRASRPRRAPQTQTRETAKAAEPSASDTAMTRVTTPAASTVAQHECHPCPMHPCPPQRPDDSTRVPTGPPRSSSESQRPKCPSRRCRRRPMESIPMLLHDRTHRPLELPARAPSPYQSRALLPIRPK